ncbi:MAG: PhoPQ-activated protein PqaA family protein [Phycisphaerales bacterium]
MKKSIFISLSILLFSTLAYGSALDDYIALSDPCYSYTLVNTSPDLYTTGYTLRLVSQQWRSSSEVDHKIWNHWMTVIVPNTSLGTMRDTALIYIDGGNHTDSQPGIDSNYRLLSASTRSVIVVLKGVPNQPLHFLDESGYRSEDDLIAYTWRKFLDGGDVNWPAQLPMVKSVVKCMDATVSFVGSPTCGSRTVNYFVLTGASKRGWTAWLTAAVDSRVTAVAPIVSDLLNMRRTFAHSWACYGFWPSALAPYEQQGIFNEFDSPRCGQLLEIVDPYQYRDRLTIPKYIINASGDNFFVSDNIQFYFHQLTGEKYLWHVPNTNHYLTGATTSVFQSLAPFYNAFLNNTPRPQFSWTVNEDHSTTVQTITTPQSVTLWQYTNPSARDLRGTGGWTSTTLTSSGGGIYNANVNLPATGWRAYFVELVFTGSPYPYHFSTEMVVVPEIMPFEADYNRDTFIDNKDLSILANTWLTENDYRDISPRRGIGDGILNFSDFANFSIHWLD